MVQTAGHCAGTSPKTMRKAFCSSMWRSTFEVRFNTALIHQRRIAIVPPPKCGALIGIVPGKTGGRITTLRVILNGLAIK
jgi:hypothetical protein